MNGMNSLKKGLRQVACLMSRYQVALLPRMLCALLQTRSVNLHRWAAVLAGSAQMASHYRCLQRFLSGTWSPQVATHLIVQQLVKPGKPILLTLDRTHWQYGQTHHNLLCLGLVHQRVSIPLEYVALGRAGNSATSDQIHVLDRALGYLSAGRCCLLADREFIGGVWLGHLLEREVDFVIRLRSNHTIKRADGRALSLARSTRNQAKGTTRVYEQVQLYEGSNSVFVHLICHRAANGQRVFLATTRTDFDTVVALYKQRWAAETAFGFLKSKGFDLEATRLRAPQRVLRLVGLLALGLLWTLCVGEHLHQQKPLPNKKHGYPAHSLFRRGLDAIQHRIAQTKQNTTSRLYNIIRLLVSCS